MTLPGSRFKELFAEALDLDSEYVYDFEGTNFIATQHSMRQSLLRGFIKNENLEDFIIRCIKAIRKKQWGYYMVYSKKYAQGIIVDYRQDYKNLNGKKHVVCITVLPRKKSERQEGTDRVIIDSLDLKKYSKKLVEYIHYLSPVVLTEDTKERYFMPIDIPIQAGNRDTRLRIIYNSNLIEGLYLESHGCMLEPLEI